MYVPGAESPMKRRQRLRFRHPSPVSLSQRERHREQSDPAPCFRWIGTRQRQGRVPLMRFLRLSETGRRPSPLKEAPPDRCHAVKPYRSSKLCLQGRRVPSVTRTDHGRCPDYGMVQIICRNNNRELSPGLCMAACSNMYDYSHRKNNGFLEGSFSRRASLEEPSVLPLTS